MVKAVLHDLVEIPHVNAIHQGVMRLGADGHLQPVSLLEVLPPSEARDGIWRDRRERMHETGECHPWDGSHIQQVVMAGFVL